MKRDGLVVLACVAVVAFVVWKKADNERKGIAATEALKFVTFNPGRLV